MNSAANTTSAPQTGEHDGIRVDDNPVPAWWHLIFIATILFAITYALFFHWSPIGWSIHDQYQADMDAHNRQAFGRFGELDHDSEIIASIMRNPAIMEATRASFVARCAACHTTNGSGMTGPNLTDEFYKNVKSLEDIYHVIDKGILAAGMPAWGRQISDTEVILLAAYSASLRGQNLPGKAAEGEAIAPWPVVEPFVLDGGDTNTKQE